MDTSHSRVLYGFLCWGREKNTSLDQLMAALVANRLDAETRLEKGT
jgi:hypothetical protein